MRRLTPLLLAAVLLTGCSATAPTPDPVETTPTAPERTEVPWDDYDASVKTRIDELTDASDCDGLQAEFDTADANSAQVAQNTDHNNAALMGYIDEALELAGCYD